MFDTHFPVQILQLMFFALLMMYHIMCDQIFNSFPWAICRRSNGPHPGFNVPNSQSVESFRAGCSSCSEQLSWHLCSEWFCPALWPGVRAASGWSWLHTSVLRVVLGVSLYRFSSTFAYEKKLLCTYSCLAEESPNSLFLPLHIRTFSFYCYA